MAQQLESHFRRALEQLADHRRRADYVPIRCAALRPEASGNLATCQFHLEHLHAAKQAFVTGSYAHGDGSWVVSFFAENGGATREQTKNRVEAIERITREINALLHELPPDLVQSLALPS